MTRRILVALLLLCPLPLLAQTSPADILVQKLSSCDAEFFRAMRQNDSTFRQSGRVESRGDIAYWKVADRTADGKNVMMFTKPIKGKVHLLGYFDEITDLGPMGAYYSWGVLASGSPDAISASIKPLVTDSLRLRKDGDVFVRSEIRDVTLPGGGWTRNDALTSGTIPKKNTVERVFLIEPAGEKFPGVTRVGCSLQGTVTPQLLAAERPDIAK